MTTNIHAQNYYFKNMPWLTLPWEGNQELRYSLARKFAVVRFEEAVRKLSCSIFSRYPELPVQKLNDESRIVMAYEQS